MSTKPVIKYTNRDFQSIKSELVQHAKRYYPNVYNDFTENSFGSMFFDSVAYVGDMLSFYLDFQANESLLETAITKDNIRKLASQMGYNYYGNPAVYGVATFYCLVPAQTTGLGPELQYIPILKKGSIIKSTNGALFRTIESVDFNDPTVDVVAAKFNETTGKPTDYALRTYGQIKSGIEYSTEVEIGSAVKFLRTRIGDNTINEVVSVYDSEGHEFFQVENLTQEVVYKEQTNPNFQSDNVPSLLKPFIASRRFTVEQDETGTYLQFGYGSENEFESDGLTDPSSVVLQMSGKNYVTDTAFDPNKFLGTDKFGIAPANTTLKVIYSGNNTLSLDTEINGLSEVSQAFLDFPNFSFGNPAVQTTVRSSLEVTNDTAIVNDNFLPTAEEIKFRAFAVYSSQNRVVTKSDYEAYCYQMPPSFGRISRIRVVNDPSGINKRLALYVISKNSSLNFVQTNDTTKSNLKVWLNKNKMLTDHVDIFDAKIINIGFDYSYTIESGASKMQVSSAVNEAIQGLFKDKSYIGEPIYLTKLYQTINRVRGVVDTLKVRPVIKQAASYSNLGLEIDEVLSKDGTYLKCPKNCVFEIKFPTQDLKGTIL